MFWGEFLVLNGGANLYADSVAGLQQEDETSLRVFLEMCAEKGLDPVKHYSGRFVVRLPEDVHARAAEIAAARSVSLNRLVQVLYPKWKRKSARTGSSLGSERGGTPVFV